MKWAMFFVLLAGVNSTIGNILLKISRKGISNDSSLYEQYISPYFLLALAFYALNVILFAKALDYLPVNVGYPILAASGFAILSLSSFFILGESLSSIQVIGIFVIIIGICMLSYSLTT